MKKLLSIILAAATLASCVQKENLELERIDNLLDVTFQTGVSLSESESESKVGTSSNTMLWSASDAIGIFAGTNNANRRFTLHPSSADSSVGIFSGQMNSVSSPVVLYGYYPYSSDASLTSLKYPDISNQVFEGSFDANGNFTSFGKYALLYGYCTGFTISQAWPQDKVITFSPRVAIVKFAINSSESNPVRVRRIGMSSQNYPFVTLSEFNPSSGSISGYYTNVVSTEISETNPLTLNSGDTKYVQMVSGPSSFSTQNISVFVECIDNTGRNYRYDIPKSVNSSKNLQIGTRASVSVPISSSTTRTYASRIKITTSSSVQSLTAPVFVQGTDYQAADSFWGDSTIEKYEAGGTHTFTSSGVHASSFNHWGDSQSVSIEKLTGITAIDFSDTF